jgi:hypothetical protein
VTFPPEYVDDIGRMATQLRDAVRAGCRLRFRMGPAEVVIVADLGEVGDAFALSDDAKNLVRMFVRDQGARGATVMMLRCALDVAEVPYTVVSVQEIGRALELARPGTTSN